MLSERIRISSLGSLSEIPCCKRTFGLSVSCLRTPKASFLIHVSEIKTIKYEPPHDKLLQVEETNEDDSVKN